MDADAKRARYNSRTESALKYYSNVAIMGRKDGWNRGWAYMYELTPLQKASVDYAMERGACFENAFDDVMAP